MSNSILKAHQQYEAAKHILTRTYPLVNDEKLLLGVMNNLLKTIEYVIDFILIQKAEPVPDSFNAKFKVFRNYCDNQLFINLITDIRNLINFQKESPVDFRRQGKFVMCGENYNLKYLTAKDVQQYLNKTKDFLDHSKGIK
jgi:hypothetical protein